MAHSHSESAPMGGPGKLYGLGVGPGDPELLTLKAARILGQVPVVFAAASTKNEHSLALSIVKGHLRPEAEVIRLGFPMTKDQELLRQAWLDNAAQVAAVLSQGLDAAFLTLGDPMIYSTFLYLERTLRELDPEVQVEVVPGVSSIQAAAAAAHQGLAESGQNLVVLSGVDDPERLRRGLAEADNAVILKPYRAFARIRDILAEAGLSHRAVLVSRCGLEGQAVVRGLEDVSRNPPYFSLILVKK